MEALLDQLHGERYPPPHGFPANDKGGATRRVLVQQLGELQAVGVVHDTVPMKTEYFLTELGETLVPIIRMMDAWENDHREMFDEMGNIVGSSEE